jgi:hypothetical protein
MRSIPVVAHIPIPISSPSSSRERRIRRIASDRGGMGPGCSCRVWLCVQTDSFSGGKRSALDTWVQVDLVTSGKFLIVRAAGVRGGATKELIDRNKHGLTFWNKPRWTNL